MNTQPVQQPTQPVAFDAPNRVWFRTENGWASREWATGEKEAYRREVLGR